jgi:NADPH-dependent ferric siderophore reductase
MRATHHGTGPGGRWAADAPVGPPAEISGPRGELELRAADRHLFVDDEAAMRVREHLGAHGVRPERTFVKGYWNAA